MYARIDTCNLKTRKEISLSSTWHMAYWKILNKITLKTSNNLTAVKKSEEKEIKKQGGIPYQEKKKKKETRGKVKRKENTNVSLVCSTS